MGSVGARAGGGLCRTWGTGGKRCGFRNKTYMGERVALGTHAGNKCRTEGI